MEHLLDNPVWSAMTLHNSNLAIGDARAKYFPKDIGPFVGLRQVDDEHLQHLYELLPAENVAALVSVNKLTIPPRWKQIHQTPLLQMLCPNPARPDSLHGIVALDEQHIPQMIALTQLTQPGPFLQRTIEFGHFTGVFDDGQLIAMAGQRMHVDGFAEITAVCTHPNHLGKGLGSALLLHQANRIKAQDEIPFLHTRADNLSAIRLYEKLGFQTRRELNIDIIKKLA